MLKNLRKEYIWLFLILLVSVVLRFWDLGYSHFYGDETKVLYLDKTVPATTFLLDQRKGPVQFLAAWFMEKTIGGYSEFWIRLPFAIAGVGSIIAFYLVARVLFNSTASIWSAFIFSISGFNIAFSRTAQYQTFVLLFGLLGLWAFLKYIKGKNSKFLLVSGLLYGLALLSHYDGIFFIIPTLVFLPELLKDKTALRQVLLCFILPILLLTGAFYIPYLSRGYFESNTLGYLSKRVSGGNDYAPNNSFYTFFVYNPFWPFIVLLVSSVISFIYFKINPKTKLLICLWALVPFILFEFVFKNPGTHIQHYFIPLYLLTGYFLALQSSKLIKSLLGLLLGLQLLYSAFIYLPVFRTNYPWKDINVFGLNLNKADKSYNLFLYGFPYNRGWDQIRSTMYSYSGVRGFYTNDNTVTAGYYLLKYPVTIPGSSFLPQYYIYVYDSQEIKVPEAAFLDNYSSLKEISVNNTPTAVIYKLKPKTN